MSLEYRRVWPGPLGELRSVYAVIRRGQFIGYAARWRSAWLVGLNDIYGTWETAPGTNLPIICQRREGVALRLALIHEGMLEPGTLDLKERLPVSA